MTEHEHTEHPEHTETEQRVADDASIARPFDNTNGVVDGLEGDSDGTADSDTASEAEREPGADDVPGAPLITNQP